MSKSLLKLLFFCTSLFSVSQIVFAETGDKNKHDLQQASKKPVLPPAASADWYAQSALAVHGIEYGFRRTGNDVVVANDRNGLRFSINAAGYSARRMASRNGQATWSAGFDIETVAGFAHDRQQAATRMLIHKDDLLLRNEAYDVVYSNTESGLRQNFVVRRKADNVNGLEVTLRLTGPLHASLSPDGRLIFNRGAAAGLPALVYDDLHVWDAAGRVLPAHFALRDDALRIVVADAGAQYPVTIDPLTHSPEWTTSANGLLSSLSQTQINSALYGYAVASAGDVNGDGYDDVAIGAPGLADIFTGTGSLAAVGAVFIFHGSSTGLSTTPSNTLQPTSAAAGALFGYSIDGADVNGDGMSDLIIGAPMDLATISVGSSTVSGQIGKAYLYSGSSLVSSNPGTSITFTASNTLISSVNASNNALFGFSVAITDDLNGDSKRDIIIGAPGYAAAGTLVAAPRTGAAFVYYSAASNPFTSFVSLNPPGLSILGITGLSGGINGLLFGYSVDGIGDYANGGHSGVVVGAPAGVDLSSTNILLNGQTLGGQAFVYLGTGTAIHANIDATLREGSNTLLGNAANLFGYKVKGLKTIGGARNGGILISSPVGGAVSNTLSLNIKTGSVHVFKSRTSTPATVVTPDQTLETPRSSSVLQVLDSIGLNLLTGVSTDNIYDVNCDGFPDIIVGEPLSTATAILALQTSPLGGSAYVFTGTSNGLFNTTPIYTVSATYDASAFSSVNVTALLGYSVAGVQHIYGSTSVPRALVGSPGGTLDFGPGLLNVGSTINTLLSFAAGNNGPGKAYTFDLNVCAAIVPLPVSLLSFSAVKKDRGSLLRWEAAAGAGIRQYGVERSADGQSWATIGNVEAGVTSSYSYTDTRPVQGMNYYRLRLQGGGDQHEFSPVANVRFIAEESDPVQIYPNPVSSELNIIVASSGAIQVRVIDAYGRTTAAFSTMLSGSNILRLSRNEAGMGAPGIYRVEIRSEAGAVSRLITVN